MYNNWQVDMDRTQKAIGVLKEIVFSGVEFRSIEKTKNEVLLWLDQYSGIDYIFKTNKTNQIVGVAARIQFDVKFETFTIRFERHTGSRTEFHKRVEAIEKGYFYPTFTLQAYFNEAENKMYHAAIIDTKKLYSFMLDNPDKVHERKSDNVFKFVYWDDLKDYRIKIFRQSKLQTSIPFPR